ncbi:MAG: hypothetical protein JJ969_00345 [Rhizobiaceae bacterium]|nr:hypothetical protein [Rhizobiaceae bacterium]MBO6727024.1 hypothetical protein [Rhizobiaceae bacterium]
MGLVKSGAAIMIAAAAAAAYVMPRAESSNVDAPQSKAPAEWFELYHAGASTGCTLHKGAPAGTGRVTLKLDGCADDLAEYADARYWSERDDGAVALVAADGAVLLQFAAGDGTAYEAFGDGVPLFSLAEKND